MTGRLPDFVGLGALKAGTTTVHALLARHPDVALPLHRKEVMFFDRHWDRGVGWYAEHFAHAGARRAGEISPNYLFDPAVPARMASVVPRARLFAVVRDPVARAVSQHRFYAKEQGYRGDLATFLREHPDAVERGYYFRQLQRFLDHFPAEQLLVVRSEDLAASPAAPVRRLLDHVGVRADVDLGDLGARHNEAAVPRLRRVWRAGRRAARWLYDHDLAWVVDGLKRTPLKRWLLRPAPKATVDPAVVAWLTERYAADQAALAAWMAGRGQA